MKYPILAVIFTTLMIYGQAANPHSDAHARNPGGASQDATDAAGQTVVVVNQQAPTRQENDHPGKPPSYFHELLANLPNLLLVGVGIGGIIIGVCTLKNIARQTGLLVVYTAATRRSLRAATRSADAARDSVNLVINKERARILLGSLAPLNLTVDAPLKAEFSLLYYGSTPAFDVTSEIRIAISESRESFEKTPFPHGIHDLPSIVFPKNITVVFNDFLLRPIPLDRTTAQKIDRSEIFVHIQAIVRYIDFFDRPRETAFHYQWNAPDRSPNSLRRIIFPEGWQVVGGQKENYYT